MFEVYATSQSDPRKVGFAQHQFFSVFATAKAFAEQFANANVSVAGEMIAHWDGTHWTVA